MRRVVVVGLVLIGSLAGVTVGERSAAARSGIAVGTGSGSTLVGARGGHGDHGMLASLYEDAPVPDQGPVRDLPGMGVRNWRAASQCSGYLWDSDDSDLAQARAIMAGWFKLGSYGHMRLAPNPQWRDQGTLTYEGNGAQHALFWALPLLRAGIRNGEPSMVRRFFAIVDDWLNDNPPRRPRSYQAFGQIETGFRLITLACAAENGGRRSGRYLRAMRSQARYAASHWVLVNNASFHAASGIFAAGCAAGDRRLRLRGLAYLDRTARAMIFPDGSVLEGSVGYARSTYVWTLDEINRIAACGVAVPRGLRRVSLIPEFLAYGVRPDGRYEAIGDGGAGLARAADAPGSPLEFAATKGARGPLPGSLYRRFDAGFIFGRSAWGDSSTFGDQTFYSVRTGDGPDGVYHAHADSGALTLHAGRSQLLFDGGPYHDSALLRGRLGHNVAAIAGVAYRSPAPEIIAAGTSAIGDLTTLVDRAYARTGLVRTIWYDRIGDFFVVIDDVEQRKASVNRGTVFQNWNFGRDREVELRGSSAATTGRGANVSVISIGGEPSYGVLRGSTRPWGGWNSTFYSELAAAPSVRVDGGRTRSVKLATVIIPRPDGVAADAVSATGYFEADGAVVSVVRGAEQHTVRIGRGGATRL